jgi:ribonuclease HI
MATKTSAEEARERLERAGAEFDETPDGWRARLGGSVAVCEDGEVSLVGNTDRLASILTDGGGRVTVEFDGASRGNPGPAAAGYVLRDDGGIVGREGVRVGEATNNEAEYTALLRGLVEARELGYGDVEAVGDSELVVRQVRGDWRCRADNLKPLRDEVLGTAEAFDGFEIRHVPRGSNEAADEAANAALDEGDP